MYELKESAVIASMAMAHYFGTVVDFMKKSAHPFPAADIEKMTVWKADAYKMKALIEISSPEDKVLSLSGVTMAPVSAGKSFDRIPSSCSFYSLLTIVQTSPP